MASLVSYLVVVGLTVRQALPLVVPVAQKWLLTLGAHKMLSTEKQNNVYLLTGGKRLSAWGVFKWWEHEHSDTFSETILFFF